MLLAYPKENHMPRCKYVCRTCSSEDVLRDAWASWDKATQSWVLANTFDHTYCESCGEGCLLKEVVDAEGSSSDG